MDVLITGLIIVIVFICIVNRPRREIPDGLKDNIIENIIKDVCIEYGEITEHKKYTPDEKEAVREITSETMYMMKTKAWDNMTKNERDIWHKNMSDRICKKYNVEVNTK